MNVLNSLAQVVLAPLDDKWFSILQYFKCRRRFPDLKNPPTFNEQIQWLKVFYRNPLLKICADKFTVRDYVAEKAGGDCLIPLLGVYFSADEINFAALPAQFVLKVSHGSGWNIFCRDKQKFDAAAARKKLARWMASDFYKVGREWAYQGLTPRIVCEKFLCTPGGEPPWDYKFFCFHGEPRYVQVDYGRFGHHTRALYDIDWNRIPCRLEYALEPHNSPRPVALQQMLDVARKLAAPFPFVRVDLYELENRVFFGEMTFYPGKGVETFSPDSYDRVFGQWLDREKTRLEIEGNDPPAA
jgi:hypothetical protein